MAKCRDRVRAHMWRRRHDANSMGVSPIGKNHAGDQRIGSSFIRISPQYVEVRRDCLKPGQSGRFFASIRSVSMKCVARAGARLLGGGASVWIRPGRRRTFGQCIAPEHAVSRLPLGSHLAHSLGRHSCRRNHTRKAIPSSDVRIQIPSTEPGPSLVDGADSFRRPVNAWISIAHPMHYRSRAETPYKRPLPRYPWRRASRPAELA
jgi:hypothetical protein